MSKQIDKRQFQGLFFGDSEEHRTWLASFHGATPPSDVVRSLRRYRQHCRTGSVLDPNFYNSYMKMDTGIKTRVAKWGKQRQYASCEIECFNVRSETREILDKLMRQKKNQGMLYVADDSTISGNYSAEIRVSYAIGQYERLYEVCNLLMKNDVQTNRSCGLHVHLDAQTMDPAQADQNWINNQDWLYKLVASSRRSGDHAESYCARANEDNNRDRYRALNLRALQAHGTIEVRLHQGTIDPKKIQWWTELCNFILRDGRTWSSVREFCQDKTVDHSLRERTWARYGALNVTGEV